MARIILFIAFFHLFLHASFDFNAKVLKEAEAFQPKITITDKSVDFHIGLGENIHIYKTDIKVTSGDKTLTLTLPKGLLDEGEEFYEQHVDFSVPREAFSASSFTLSFQGCSTGGICYPPQTITKTLPTTQTTTPTTQTTPATNREESIAQNIQTQSLWVTLGTFFAFGLLLALTPCIFPMIPILSSIIVGQKNITTKRAFLLSLVYVLAMALTYTIAGVFAGLFGSNLQALFQNPYIVSTFALIFVALAFSMFGYYELQIPASWQSKISKRSDKASSQGGIAGIAIMGFLSALIVGPCIAPPLAGALIYIGQTGDALIGGLALFSMSIGMGIPLLIIGTGAGKYMPKPGGWMSAVTKFFGIVMLGIAIWMLSKIIPAHIELLLWALLFIGSALYYGALESGHFLKRSISFIALLYGILLFVGAFLGASSLMNPLEPLKSVSHENKALRFERVATLNELQAKIKNNPRVFVDFSAQWCTSCKELEEKTFKDGALVAHLEQNYLLLQVDITQNSDEDKRILKHFNLFGPPALLIFENAQEKHRVIGFIKPQALLERLK
jgi:thiol:disulfide interchange protein DsbD